MISITVQSSEGTVLAYAEHPEEAWLSVDRAYLPGDVIRITGSSRLRVRRDQALPAGEVFLPSGIMTWPVPAGEHRLAYAPGTFEAPRHIIFAAAVPDSGLHRIRNLALNPADLRGDTDFYPHCTANVETRNKACFCARNVIDGLRLNSFHGEWPFQSWGIGAREDGSFLFPAEDRRPSVDRSGRQDRQPAPAGAAGQERRSLRLPRPPPVGSVRPGTGLSLPGYSGRFPFSRKHAATIEFE